MKILYFAAHALWPPNTGARLRDYHLAQQLGKRAEVTFAEMRGAAGGKQAPSSEKQFAESDSPGKRTHLHAIENVARPCRAPAHDRAELPVGGRGAAVAETLQAESFDTVQVEGVHLLEYLPVLEQSARHANGIAARKPAVVVDWHNMESESMRRYAEGGAPWAKRLAARRTANLLARAEDQLLRVDVTHTVTSERERRILLARHAGADVRVIPNGIDTDFYSAANLETARGSSHARERNPSLLFVGSMDYHANVDAVLWFARAVWPQIARTYPALQFTIVGRDPAREIRALASERIRVTGTVDDVRPYYAAAAAAVVPIRAGGGTRLKILEAMAAGVPVISTTLDAEGLETENGAHLLLADGAAEMAAAVELILASAPLRAVMTKAARSLACRKYDWNSIGTKLFEIHERVAAARRVSIPEKAMAL